MSSNYSIYLEAKINDKWECINGQVPSFNYDYKSNTYSGDFKYKLQETYWNGSRSYFSEAKEKFENIGDYGKFSELSRTLQDCYEGCVSDESNGVYCGYYVIIADFNKFKDCVALDKYDTCGVVRKDHIFKYDNGDLEELYSIDHDEYKELSDEEKKQYVYYEWDDCWGWNINFKEIYRNALKEISDFEEANYGLADRCSYRLVLIGD